MLDRLPPREREIVDILYQKGESTVAEVCQSLSAPLTGSAVRAMLTRLERKGAVLKRESARGHLYAPALAEEKAGRTALSNLVRTFFNGSPASAASALLGMSEKLDPAELDEIEAMIAAARARKEGR